MRFPPRFTGDHLSAAVAHYSLPCVARYSLPCVADYPLALCCSLLPALCYSLFPALCPDSRVAGMACIPVVFLVFFCEGMADSLLRSIFMLWSQQ